MKPVKSIIALTIGAAALSACATAPGPVEVTRFHNAATLAQLGQGAIYIESAPGNEGNALEMAQYKSAVARELAKLGYVESNRERSGQIAQVRIERYSIGPEGRRGPVNVGVGGSTGTYGSGLGLGIGINLGGDGRKTGTEMSVMIRDKASTQALWEGRAQFTVGVKSDLASAAANADVVAGALFRDFPGGNGETIQVGVSE